MDLTEIIRSLKTEATTRRRINSLMRATCRSDINTSDILLKSAIKPYLGDSQI